MIFAQINIPRSPNLPVFAGNFKQYSADLTMALTRELVQLWARAETLDDNSNIQDKVIKQEYIADLAVGTAQIDNLSVGTAQIANLAVTNAKIGLLAVDSAQIADLAVGTAKIALLAVGAAQIALLAVGTAQIDALAVTNAKINDLSAEKINAGYLSANRIEAASIVAEKLNVTTLSAISANMGTITAGSITAGNVNADVLTSGSLDSTRIRIFDYKDIGGTNVTTFDEGLVPTSWTTLGAISQRIINRKEFAMTINLGLKCAVGATTTLHARIWIEDVQHSTNTYSTEMTSNVENAWVDADVVGTIPISTNIVIHMQWYATAGGYIGTARHNVGLVWGLDY